MESAWAAWEKLMSFKVMMVFGTRPEAIKMAPRQRVLRQWPGIELNICSTGQHREMLKQVLDSFELAVDEDLQVMTQGQTLNGLSEQLLEHLDSTYERVKPDIVLVHGDTTTSFIAALAAFNRQLPIGHVEAGLRTGNLRAPVAGRSQPAPDRGDRRPASRANHQKRRQSAARRRAQGQHRSHRQYRD